MRVTTRSLFFVCWNDSSLRVRPSGKSHCEWCWRVPWFAVNVSQGSVLSLLLRLILHRTPIRPLIYCGEPWLQICLSGTVVEPETRRSHGCLEHSLFLWPNLILFDASKSLQEHVSQTEKVEMMPVVERRSEAQIPLASPPGRNEAGGAHHLSPLVRLVVARCHSASKWREAWSKMSTFHLVTLYSLRRITDSCLLGHIPPLLCALSPCAVQGQCRR